MTPKTRANAKKPGEITLAEAARRLGITPQSTGQWARRLNAPARVDGRNVYVSWPQFARWREEELIAAAMPADLDTLRARKVQLEIEAAEFELAKVRGQMVTVDDFSAAFGRALDLIMARVRQLPTRCAHLGAEVEAVVEQEVETLVQEVHEQADSLPDVLPDPDSPTD